MLASKRRESIKYVWLLVFSSILIWSGVYPKDYFTWSLEVAPAIMITIVLIYTYKTFPLTPLAYTLILIHCVILMIGGHYTYAEVPIFDTLKEVLNSDRNNFDKVGHFAQGFVPSIVVREFIIRKSIINGVKWQYLFIVFFCLGFSAFYELIEWWVALATGENAEAFLGTQGYIWDTQSDMAYALLGALFGLFIFNKTHDKQIRKIVTQDKVL